MNCYEKAASLLAGTDHCRRGLRRKLADRGYGEEEISAALDRLTREGFLDDRRYAGLWIEFRQRRTREGRRLLLEGLVKRGVDRETAAAAVREAAASEAYRAALAAAYERILRDGDPGRDGIVSRLIRKGYSQAEVREFLQNRDED